MAYDLNIVHDLIGETCYLCTVRFAITRTLQSKRRKDGREFYCPNGHSQSYQETEADRLRKELEEKTAQSDRYSRRYEEEKRCCVNIGRTATALRGHITRLKSG